MKGQILLLLFLYGVCEAYPTDDGTSIIEDLKDNVTALWEEVHKIKEALQHHVQGDDLQIHDHHSEHGYEHRHGDYTHDHYHDHDHSHDDRGHDHSHYDHGHDHSYDDHGHDHSHDDHGHDHSHDDHGHDHFHGDHGYEHYHNDSEHDHQNDAHGPDHHHNDYDHYHHDQHEHHSHSHEEHENEMTAYYHHHHDPTDHHHHDDYSDHHHHDDHGDDHHHHHEGHDAHGHDESSEDDHHAANDSHEDDDDDDDSAQEPKKMGMCKNCMKNKMAKKSRMDNHYHTDDHHHHHPHHHHHIGPHGHYSGYSGSSDHHEKRLEAQCIIAPNVEVPESNVTGKVIISQRKDGKGPLYFDINLEGVEVPEDGTARIHGFHIHEEAVDGGKCSTAGPHFNPTESTHGPPYSLIRHAGDLGNIKVDEYGHLHHYIISDDKVSFAGPNSIVSRSIVLHALADDLGQGGDEGSLKTGNAGPRLACCTIEAKDLSGLGVSGVIRFNG